MEEADLLKERLQAITDKRKIREDIAQKRREIEEEKLKLQYIKKKALREQWLMDGLSQQTEEELEAMKQQAQDEQQQSDQLQSNILRIEKEISDLENEELQLSANEEVILKRLKEVERTNEDIIKEIQEEFHADVSPPDPVPRPDIPTISQPAPAAHPTRLPDTEGSKKATFAVEIQVEHDKRTGKSQVVSTAAVTAEALQERGLKVYEDGRKCIYAVNTHKSDVGEMTRGEAEELLLKATDKDVPTDVQYHQPVYSTAYNGNSRPSTPRSPGLTPKLRGGSRPSSQLSLILDGQRTPGATTQPKFLKPKDTSPTPSYEEDIPMHLEDEKHSSPKPCSHHLDEEHVEEHLNSQVESQAQPAVVAVKVRSEEVSMPIQSIYRDTDSRGQTPDHEAWMQMDSLAAELESGPVTMIFMGYERAEEEEEGFQAELVVIDGSDDDHNEEGEEQETSEDLDDSLSYHPEGYKSQVFKPTVSVAQVSGSGEIVDGDPPLQNSLGIHKPTFTHKSRKQNLPRRGVDGSESKGGLNMEKMKLSSTER